MYLQLPSGLFSCRERPQHGRRLRACDDPFISLVLRVLTAVTIQPVEQATGAWPRKTEEYIADAGVQQRGLFWVCLIESWLARGYRVIPIPPSRSRLSFRFPLVV